MYTRIKSKKSGIKVGINTIANNPRQRVLSSSTIVNSDSKKISDANNNVISNPISSPELNSALMATASIVLDDKNNFSPDAIKDNATIPTVSNAFQMENNPEKPKKKSNKDKKIVVDENVDPICITYVKSMWEKYSDKIGTENGPLRHIDESSQDYPHLNNFVAFDMELWWAQRSISCMMNEKSQGKSTDSLNEMKTHYKNKIELNHLKNCFSIQLNTQSSCQKSFQNINMSELCLS